MSAHRSILMLLALVLASACSRSVKRAGSPAANTAGTADRGAPTPVSTVGAVSGERLGTIHVIGTGRRFVLVETPAMQPVSALTDGQALLCRAAGVVTSTLRVSHERRPPFVVADVTAGEPHLGDEVFIDKTPGRTAVAAAGPTPSSPASAPPPAALPDFRANPALPPAH